MAEKLQKFLLGRNGSDQLSLALLILSLILSIISSVTEIPTIAVISYIPLGLSIYRIFSKNVNKRRMENYKFMMLLSPIYSSWHKIRQRIKNRKKYKYFKCPFCSQKLRVPRGKGRVNITCSNCKEKFTKRT